MAARCASESGSALLEAAIVFPCLVLIVYASAALSDVMVLKLKAAEALRYSLWETTVFKPPALIESEVQQKFVDLRSPRDLRVPFTGLLLYPLASGVGWSASVDVTSQRVSIGGDARIPSGTALQGWLSVVMAGLSRGVDAETRREKFNGNGAALARVALVRGARDRASPLLNGGDLPGLRGGHDLAAPSSLTDFRLEAPLASQRPMQLVFDTWKAWPKPAAFTFTGAATDTSVPPQKTYPVVETQVSAQVGHIAFFGLGGQPWFRKLRELGNTVLHLLGPVAGGDLPDVFSTERMDGAGTNRGPITILPPKLASESWVPRTCDFRGREENCSTQRLGDLRVSGSAPTYLDETATLGDKVDRTRYTLPFAIHTQYWTEGGGTSGGDDTGQNRRMAAPPARITTDNAYARTYACRGHYFAGSQRPQETDATRRYGGRCHR